MKKPGLLPIEKQRYARQLIIPEIGEEGQLKIKAASVLIVGSGGLGSASALYLAAAGIGRLGILDSDIVDISNLQRQIIHTTATIGEPKVNSARSYLENLNPSVTINALRLRLSRENVHAVVRDYAIIIDAADNFTTRYLLNEACVEQGRPFIYGAIYQFYGQMSVFWAPKGPCFQCVFHQNPEWNEYEREIIGVVGVIPGTIGTLQGMEAIKIILEKGTPAVGRLILYNGLDMKFQEVLLKKDRACPICGSKK